MNKGKNTCVCLYLCMFICIFVCAHVCMVVYKYIHDTFKGKENTTLSHGYSLKSQQSGQQKKHLNYKSFKNQF